MTKVGRGPKKELRTYIPLVIEKLGGKGRAADIKRYFDQRITPRTGFKAGYNTIVKYCEQLCDDGILLRQVALNNIDKVKKDGRRNWIMSIYRLVSTKTQVVFVEKTTAGQSGQL